MKSPFYRCTRYTFQIFPSLLFFFISYFFFSAKQSESKKSNRLISLALFFPFSWKFSVNWTHAYFLKSSSHRLFFTPREGDSRKKCLEINFVVPLHIDCFAPIFIQKQTNKNNRNDIRNRNIPYSVECLYCHWNEKQTIVCSELEHKVKVNMLWVDHLGECLRGGNEPDFSDWKWR